jgi:hypothetical protein
MGFMKMIAALCAVVQSPSQPACMYPEQWNEPTAIYVDDVPRYPGSYGSQMFRAQPKNCFIAALDCF